MSLPNIHAWMKDNISELELNKLISKSLYISAKSDISNRRPHDTGILEQHVQVEGQADNWRAQGRWHHLAANLQFQRHRAGHERRRQKAAIQAQLHSVQASMGELQKLDHKVQ